MPCLKVEVVVVGLDLLAQNLLHHSRNVNDPFHAFVLVRCSQKAYRGPSRSLTDAQQYVFREAGFPLVAIDGYLKVTRCGSCDDRSQTDLVARAKGSAS